MVDKNRCLEGRSAIITGGSRGLGKEIALTFIENGASVTICARNERELFECKKEILDSFPGLQKDRLTAVRADVSVMDDVKHVVSEAFSHYGRIDILINNAGIHGAKGRFDKVDIELWKSAFDTNLYGTVYFMREVFPYMKDQKFGRIINISGGGATAPRPFFSGYGVSKTAVVRLTETVAAEWKEFGISINAISPGAMNTALCDDIISGGEALGKEYLDALRRKEEGGDSLTLPAQLCLFLSSEKSDGITGRLLSAKWDKWDELPDELNEFMESDVYTLRRITARDRGYAWDK